MKTNLKMRVWALALLAVFVLTLSAQPVTAASGGDAAAYELPVGVTFGVLPNITDTTIYRYNASALNTPSGRYPGTVPSYYIYGDGKYTEQEAYDLLAEMGIFSHLQTYTTNAYIINPVGDAFGEADKEVYLQILRYAMPGNGTNIKFIGIGEGADFVNNYVSQNSWPVAGIMTYGGNLQEGLTYEKPIPAYISGGAAGLVDYYKNANATDTQTVLDGVTVYSNSAEPFQNVAVGGAEDSLAVAFEKAWANIFCKNYRTHNYLEEFYTSNPLNYPEPYELVSYPMFDALGIEFTAVQQNLIGGDNNNLWQEYIPLSAKDMPAKSVPLVMLMHGNGNDNRTQPETSGWVELAAKYGFIAVSAEWQGSGSGTFTALGEAGTMTLIAHLQEKYPQINPGRVYMCGLSAGANSSLNYGFRNAAILTAVGGTAPVGGSANNIVVAEANKKEGQFLPVFISAGDRDVYRPIPVGSLFNQIKAYQTLNFLPMSAAADLSLNRYYGLSLDGQRWTTIGTREALVGDVKNEDGMPLIRLVGLHNFAHWNYKPIAQEMWEFFSMYERDMETGATIYNGPVLTDVAVSTPKIVATLGANLNITYNADNMDTSNLDAFLDVDGVRLGNIVSASEGKIRLNIPAAPAAGTYKLVVGENGNASSCDITVVEYSEDLWVATAFGSESGQLNIRFNAQISSKTAFAGAVTIGSSVYSATVEQENTLVVPVAYDSLAAGQKIVVKGVKFAELFPSYVFSFTVTK